MIPKAEILASAEELGLLPTTVEKDYALGWVLFGVAHHAQLSQWYFKGGTCLKKCYFDTYRFSEDLDFTVPPRLPYTADAIRTALLEMAAWVREEAGLDLPPDGVQVDESVNKRGQPTFEARVTYVGPLALPRAQRQRIRFDLTRDETVLDPPDPREVFHGYSDAPHPIPRVRCYSLAEILAEKVRALYERSGRARDVYDVVNVGRNLQRELPAERVAALAVKKFEFKALAAPTPEMILERVQVEILEADWAQALRHQLPALPAVPGFVAALREILAWLLGVAAAPAARPGVPRRPGETPVPPLRFSRPAAAARALGLGWAAPREGWPAGVYGGRMDRLRYAARNRLLARVHYHGVSRLVEPYSLRVPRTGNLLLYVFEVERGAGRGEGLKALKVGELGDVQVTDVAFQPRYLIEL